MSNDLNNQASNDLTEYRRLNGLDQQAALKQSYMQQLGQGYGGALQGSLGAGVALGAAQAGQIGYGPNPGVVVYLISVDDQSGRYLAISAADPKIKAVAFTENDALGALVRANPGICIRSVVSIDASGKTTV